MTDQDLQAVCQHAVNYPLLAPPLTVDVAGAVLRLLDDRRYWRDVQYRRIALAWIQTEGDWTTRLDNPVRMWYSVHPHAHRFWVYGGFAALSEGQTFCQAHANALARGVDHLIGVIPDAVLT